MKILFFLIPFILLFADGDVYSETNSYNIHQETNIDNSKILSDNQFNFSLFQKWGNDYSEYMNDEPILYLSAYFTGTFGGTTQEVIGLQLGVYESVYLIYEQGKYSQGEDSAEYDDSATAEGDFYNIGISYHLSYEEHYSYIELISIDFIQRKMTNTTYKRLGYWCDDEDDKCPEKNKDATILMWNYTYFKKNAHTGFEFGVGVGEDIFIGRVGLKFRFF